jgi:hypothetical protein
MLKKLFALTFAVLVLVATLTSCKIFNKNPGGGNDNGGDTATSHAIFSPELSINLVKGSGAKDLNDAANRIYDLTGRIAGVIICTKQQAAYEIIFGKAEARPIVDVAEQKLQALVRRATLDFEDAGKDVNRLGVFVIYAEGGSVVMLWNNNNIAESAVEFFMENYMTNTKLVLEDGYTYSESFDFIEFMEKAEETQRQKYLDEIAKQYDDEVARAVDSLWSIVDDRYVLWLADLYDPGEYDEDGNPKGGGFYYSNSARDNNGYGIDLESTAQILSFMTSSGMLPNRNGVLREYFPEKMQKEMLAFALSCQSPIDGCFYHPQWGMNIQESRKSRDHGWALDILTAFGGKPYFNSDLGIKNGIYGDPPGYEVDVDEYIESLTSPTALTNRLGSSSVSAVSKVVTVSSDEWTGSAMFKDLDAWIKYLEALESTIRTKSYSIGNTVSGLATQAKNREKMALEKGELFDNDGDGYADGGYREQFRNYFNKWMLPENGVWEYGTVEEGTITYASINGLMKTIGAYNGFGFKHPYAEKAIESALFIATLDGPDVKGADASASVDVFNPFVAIELTLKNMKTYGSNEEAIAINNMIKERAAEVINITREKIVDFKKDDGSFGYTKTVSPSTSQGAPTSVPYTVEGDVNGGTIALTAITGNMTSALGISGLYIYYPSDFEVFIKRASEHEAVEKEEIEVFPLEFDFEDEKSGETAPDGVEVSLTDGALNVSEVEGKKGSTKALRLKTVKDKGDAFTVKPLQIKQQGLNRYILEWDMKFDEIGGGFNPAMQITLGNMYMLTLKVTKDGILSFGDASTTSSSAISSTFKGSFDAYAWHNVRIEHYPFGGEPITMVFVDGELIAESRNYKESQAGAPATPQYTEARFYCLFSTDFVAYFDNLKLDADGENYVGNPPAEEEKYLGELDFEGEELGEPNLEGLTTTPNPEDGNSIVIAKENETSENTVLKLTAKSSKTAGNWVKVKAPTATLGGAYVYELDIFAETLNRTGDIAQIYLRNEKGAVIFALNMTFLKSGDGHKLLFKEKTEDSSVNSEILRVDDVISGWFTLRIEYDPATQTAKVTVNGTYSGETDAYYSEGTKTSAFGSADFYTTFATDAVILLDNISVKK